MNSQLTADAKPTHEQISLRAELLWKAKGAPSGQDEQIWLEAEKQLSEEAKELLANSAASTSPTDTTVPASTNKPAPEPSSVSSEKMNGKANAKSGKESRRK